MKTILIPTDFSNTANNAARYGVDFACNVGAEKIVLYNAYAIPLATEMTWALMESEDLKKASEAGLAETKMLLTPFCSKGIQIETMADFGFFGQRINDVATDAHADIIIMGITGGSGISTAIFGSNALSAVHHTKLPLLIVPPGCSWKPIEKIAWACDYENVRETTPLHSIDEVLNLTHAQLHVLHNEKNHENFDPETVRASSHINDFFKNRTFEISIVEGRSLSESVNQYVFDHGIDWLIVVPHKHSWLAGLFSKDHTKELAFHTHIPMLCLQQ
ncbi:MAG: universal stress protein [Bacteroidota bacterium]